MLKKVGVASSRQNPCPPRLPSRTVVAPQGQVIGSISRLCRHGGHFRHNRSRLAVDSSNNELLLVAVAHSKAAGPKSARCYQSGQRPHRTFISLISLPDSGHTSRPRRLAASRQQTLLRSASLVLRLMNECSTCISNLMRDALSRFDLLAREARRRRSYKAGERDGERALRAVADTLRDLADADLAPPE